FRAYLEAWAIGGDAVLGPAEQLAAGALRLLQHTRDLVILVLKYFPKQKDRTLSGRQPFQENEKRHGDRFVSVGLSLRVAQFRLVGAKDSLVQPRPNVHLALRLLRGQVIQARTRHKPGQM